MIEITKDYGTSKSISKDSKVTDFYEDDLLPSRSPQAPNTHLSGLRASEGL